MMSIYDYLVITVVLGALLCYLIIILHDKFSAYQYQKKIDAFMQEMQIIPLENDMQAPWVFGLNYPPYDIFWRQGGEARLYYVWIPFWKTLDEKQKQEYLARWRASDDWRFFLLEPLDEDDEGEVSVAEFIINKHIKQAIQLDNPEDCRFVSISSDK